MLVEIAGPVVPVAEQPIFRVSGPKSVDETPSFERSQRVTLGLTDMGRAHERLGVPHIPIVGGNVEVAAHGNLLTRTSDYIEVLAYFVHPGQLVLVVIRVEAPSVRHVHARHGDAPAAGRDDAGVRVG